MQVKYFQRIHGRFIRDPEFRSRMIENHHDEELCRRWDALSDEDHTHHLTTKEYSLYQSKWWLHSNKQASNTVPLRQRPDFKQALSTLHRLHRETEVDPQVPTYSNARQQWAQSFFFYMVELARVMVDSLSFQKSRWKMHQVLNGRGDLLIAVFGKILLDKTFTNSTYFVTDGSFAADVGLL